jgi:hypothetical protein
MLTSNEQNTKNWITLKIFMEVSTAIPIIYLMLLKGLEGLCSKLKVDVRKGLTPADLPERAAHFGDNRTELPVAEGFWTKFIGALDEFML